MRLKSGLFARTPRLQRREQAPSSTRPGTSSSAGAPRPVGMMTVCRFGETVVFALSTATISGVTSLYAGGSFTSNTGGSQSLLRIVRWSGTSWVQVGAGLTSEVRALASFDGGTGPALYAGGGNFFPSGGSDRPLGRLESGAPSARLNHSRGRFTPCRRSTMHGIRALCWWALYFRSREQRGAMERFWVKRPGHRTYRGSAGELPEGRRLDDPRRWNGSIPVCRWLVHDGRRRARYERRGLGRNGVDGNLGPEPVPRSVLALVGDPRHIAFLALCRTELVRHPEVDRLGVGVPGCGLNYYGVNAIAAFDSGSGLRKVSSGARSSSSGPERPGPIRRRSAHDWSEPDLARPQARLMS